MESFALQTMMTGIPYGVVFGPLTFLVGPDGSGKSSFRGAIRLIAGALDFSAAHGKHMG